MNFTSVRLSVAALCAAFFSLIFTASAEERSPFLPSGHISVFRYDKYLANRISRNLSDQPSLWYEVNLEWSCGFYFTWLEIHGTDDNDWSTDASDETQVTAGYKWRLDEYTFRLQATTINIHPLERWLDNDRWVFEFFVARSWKWENYGTHTVTPEFRFGWIADSQKVAKGVPYIMPAVFYRFDEPFGLKLIALQSRVGFGYDGGLLRNEAGEAFLHAEVGLQWKLKPNVTLTLPGIRTIVPLTHRFKDGREDNSNAFFFGIMVKF